MTDPSMLTRKQELVDAEQRASASRGAGASTSIQEQPPAPPPPYSDATTTTTAASASQSSGHTDDRQAPSASRPSRDTRGTDGEGGGFAYPDLSQRTTLQGPQPNVQLPSRGAAARGTSEYSASRSQPAVAAINDNDAAAAAVQTGDDGAASVTHRSNIDDMQPSPAAQTSSSSSKKDAAQTYTEKGQRGFAKLKGAVTSANDTIETIRKTGINLADSAGEAIVSKRDERRAAGGRM